MNQKDIDYIECFNSIADAITNVSNLNPQVDAGNLYSKSELATYKEQLAVAAEKSEMIVSELEELSVSKVLTTEHNQIMDGINTFIRGAELMKESMDIEDQSIDELSYIHAKIIIKKGIKEIEIASKSIGD